MADTRRLAAIMAIDVVGYSRLMGEDEAGTARAVREHRDAARPIVAGLGGRIVKTMGDGLLLEFPSVVAAVECAAAIGQRGRTCICALRGALICFLHGESIHRNCRLGSGRRGVHHEVRHSRPRR